MSPWWYLRWMIDSQWVIMQSLHGWLGFTHLLLFQTQCQGRIWGHSANVTMYTKSRAPPPPPHAFNPLYLFGIWGSCQGAVSRLTLSLAQKAYLAIWREGSVPVRCGRKKMAPVFGLHNSVSPDSSESYSSAGWTPQETERWSCQEPRG